MKVKIAIQLSDGSIDEKMYILHIRTIYIYLLVRGFLFISLIGTYSALTQCCFALVINTYRKLGTQIRRQVTIFVVWC